MQGSEGIVVCNYPQLIIPLVTTSVGGEGGRERDEMKGERGGGEEREMRGVERGGGDMYTYIPEAEYVFVLEFWSLVDLALSQPRVQTLGRIGKHLHSYFSFDVLGAPHGGKTALPDLVDEADIVESEIGTVEGPLRISESWGGGRREEGGGRRGDKGEEEWMRKEERKGNNSHTLLHVYTHVIQCMYMHVACSSSSMRCKIWNQPAELPW